MCAALLASGCGERRRQDRGRTEGDFTVQVLRAQLSRQAVDRAADRAGTEHAKRGARRCPTSRSRWTRSTTPKTIPNWRRPSARCGSSNGGPGRSPSRPCETEEVSLAGRRPDRVRQHLGARAARARAGRDVPLEVIARQAGPARRPLHGRRRPRRQGQGPPAARAAPGDGPVRGLHHARRRRQRHVNPNTGRVQPGEYPKVAGSSPSPDARAAAFGRLSKDRASDFARR